MSAAEFRVDPAKIDARLAEYEAEATILDRMADLLDETADEKRREASRLRAQNSALLETARKHGYPESHDDRTPGGSQS